MTRAQDEMSPAGGRPPAGQNPAVTAGAYAALFLLGAVQAVIGTFQYSRGPGVVVPICFALGIAATCLLGGWGMRTVAGGVLPAVGWFVVSIVLGTSGAGGSVIITNTTQGTWFLFGGALCAGAGAVIAFGIWSRPRHGRRAERGQAGGGPPRGSTPR